MKKIFFLLFPTLLGCSNIPKGVFKQKVTINTKPTPAKIFVNDKYIGISPVETTIWYEKEEFVNIKAEPFYESQFPQNIYMKIPPIPPKMTIYMDYEAKEKLDIIDKINKQLEVIPEPEENTKEIVEVVKIIKEPTLIRLPEIYFDTDKYILSAKEKEKMDNLIEILKDHSDYGLVIHAYADERGDPDYNRKLSFKRGMAVKKYLAQNVSNEIRIVVHGERVTFSEDNKKLDYLFNRVVNFSLEYIEDQE